MLKEPNLSEIGSEPAVWRPKLGVLPEPIRPGYYPWEATPGKINHYAIAESQAEVRDQALRALDPDLRPPFVSDALADFVEQTYLSREANRAVENSESYDESLHILADLDLDLKLKLEKAELGRAKPSEILELIDELGMDSAELARLTHIYGYRLEYQQAMREHVKAAIWSKDGEVYDEPEVKYAISSFDVSFDEQGRLSRPIAIAMNRKTAVGRVGGTVIYERTTFILRIDQGSDINQDLARYIRLLDSRDPAVIMADSRFIAEVERLLNPGDLESVIPMSTTIYACNSENRALNKQERRNRKTELNRDIEAMTPAGQVLRRNNEYGRLVGEAALSSGAFRSMFTSGVPSEVVDELNDSHRR